MNDYPGYARAQRMYDAQTPPEDGPYECPDCNARGGDEAGTCRACDGLGWIDADGQPCKDPDSLAEDRADAMAESRRMEREYD